MTPATGPSRVVLLGPQRHAPDVGGVWEALGRPGPVAIVTAGWQEWEQDDDRLRDAFGGEAFNLRLYARAERAWKEDPALAEEHGKLQADVRLLRRAYNVRLAHAMDAWTDLQRLAGSPAVLDAEQASAMAAVRALDDHHANRLETLRRAFHDRFDPRDRPVLADESERLSRALERAAAVFVAGGHVPSLLNRLRLFGVDRMLDGKIVLASGGGAMALARRVVLFHDTPPWGPGHAEMGETGLALYPDVIALPDAATRLRLDDAGRVSRMARRFAPDSCVLLDAGARADWDGRWHPGTTLRLGRNGSPETWEHAA